MQLKQLKNPDFIRRLFCVLLCAAVFCGVFSYSAHAIVTEGTAPTVQPSEDIRYVGDLFCPYNYDGLTGRVIHCIENIVFEAASTFLEGFLPLYEAVIIAMMVLAVTIYGAMVAMGSITRLAGQSFFFLFKLGGVAFFALGFANMLELIFDIMHGLLLIVSNYVTVSDLSACSDDGRLSEVFSLERENFSVWDKVDCMFITLLGIAVTQTALIGMATTVSFGLVAVLTHSLFTGGIGLIIVLVAVFAMLTLLVSVLRAMKIYLVSVITIAFLVCISPIIIPLLLFSSTRPLFDKWLKNLANYMIVPIFLFAFLSMIVAAYDAILFRGTSSLYWAIASEASQEETFNFKDWLEYGTSGRVIRYPDGTPTWTDDGRFPLVDGGEFVGKDIPGKDAIALMGYKEKCATASAAELQIMEDICNTDLDTLIQCAANPVVPMAGDSISLNEDEPCTALEDQGRPYYGFLRNEELFHFAIAPNIETDQSVRAKRDDECGNIFCSIGRGIKSAGGWVVGKAFDAFKQVVGAIWRVGGWLTQLVGNLIKVVGSFVGDYCNMGTLTPGAICDVVSGAFMVAGNVVHGVGTIANFSGRVLMNGLAAELGELFDGWFDIETLDFQKIASYRCSVDAGLGGGSFSGPTDVRYLECPGPEDVIFDIFYVMITAAVVAYLMFRWLNYIPSLGSTLVGSARMETSLPGESTVQKGTSKVQHGIEKMLSKKRKGVG